jgi:hypothetical protein
VNGREIILRIILRKIIHSFHLELSEEIEIKLRIIFIFKIVEVFSQSSQKRNFLFIIKVNIFILQRCVVVFTSYVIIRCLIAQIIAHDKKKLSNIIIILKISSSVRRMSNLSNQFVNQIVLNNHLIITT